jgi:hypothetical protein
MGSESDQSQDDQSAGKAKGVLKDAADWVADRLDGLSGRLHSDTEHNDTEDKQPSVAYRPAAPVQGDAGARAAGSTEDHITETD